MPDEHEPDDQPPAPPPDGGYQQPPPGAQPPWGAPPPPPPPGPYPGAFGAPPPPPAPQYGQPQYGQPQYGQPQYGQPQYGPQLAGFGARLGAYLLDALIVGVPLGLFNFVFLRALPTKITTCTIDNELRLCKVPTGSSWAIWAVVAITLSVLVLVYYFARPIGSTGQTVGKRAAGVKVLDAATGQPIGTGRAVGRQFAYFLSSFLCYLGFLWMLWDPKKQTWHDKIVGTVVIKA